MKKLEGVTIIDKILNNYPVFEIGCLLNGIVWGIILGKILG